MWTSQTSNEVRAREKFKKELYCNNDYNGATSNYKSVKTRIDIIEIYSLLEHIYYFLRLLYIFSFVTFSIVDCL